MYGRGVVMGIKTHSVVRRRSYGEAHGKGCGRGWDAGHRGGGGRAITHRGAPSKRCGWATGFVVALAGCSDPGLGSLKVNYNLGPTGTDACADLSLDRIEGRLDDAESEIVEEATCGADLVFSEIRAGTRRLFISALNSEGALILDNSTTEDLVKVSNVQPTETEVLLLPVPAQVFVRWRINADGFQVSCDTDAVKTHEFVVTVWSGVDLLASHVFRCDEPAKEDSYVQIPDDDRRLLGSAITEVSVQPREGRGSRIGDLVRFPLNGPLGAARQLYLTVECDNNICAAVGAPPYDEPPIDDVSTDASSGSERRD